MMKFLAAVVLCLVAFSALAAEPQVYTAPPKVCKPGEPCWPSGVVIQALPANPALPCACVKATGSCKCTAKASAAFTGTPRHPVRNFLARHHR